MANEKETNTQMGRPKVYGEETDFEMRKWSTDIIKKIDAKLEEQRVKEGRKRRASRRSYIEYLLRSHPEMQREAQ